MQKIVPPLLKAGDEIRVVAPSRGIRIIGTEARNIAKQRFEAMGLKVSFGRHTTDDNWDSFGTSAIADRVADINEAFADPAIKAVFTIIGGFNSNQLLPFLDYELIRNNPKIFCGFSDITALVNGIYAQTGMVCFLGPHYSSMGMQKGIDYTWQSLRHMLLESGKQEVAASGEWSDDPWFLDQEKREFIQNDGYWEINRGDFEGTLVGGNLGTLVLLNGSPYRPEFKDGTVLAVENNYTSGGDDAEFLRQLQAMAYQPDFAKVKGLLIGRFQKASGMTRDKLEYIVRHIPQLNGIPVMANLDFGHTTPLLTLPIGGTAESKAGRLTVTV